MEHLSIGQAKNEKRKLENELELYLEKKKINFERTQPSSPKLKDVIPGKSNSITVYDKLTHYTIRNEELDQTIYALQEEINAIERYIINEMRRISEAPESERIVYFRDEEKKSWEEIHRIVHYSVRQCQRYYKEYKDKK